MGGMARLVPLALAAALLAAPATAQEEPGLLDRGLESFLQNFAQDVQPPLEELFGISATYLGAIQGFLEEMGPAFAEVVGQVDSFAYYEPPRLTPEGDIVIERRADAPAWVPPEPGAEPPPGTTPEARPAPEAPPAPEPTPEPPAEEEEGGSWFGFDLFGDGEPEPSPESPRTAPGGIEL